jgi:alpha-beta hydrolase superfamily lysophospholipase
MPSSTFSYTSADGARIAAYRWDPAGEPRALRGAIQLTHGMGEHARRYEHVARALNEAGFVVYAQDHRGHGASADPEALGDLGKGGWPGLVDDIGLLSARIRAEHPGLPLILLGHSMGSFAVQQYLFDHSADVDGVVLTGTAAIDLLEGALDLDQPIDLSEFNAPFQPARHEILNETNRDDVIAELTSWLDRVVTAASASG